MSKTATFSRKHLWIAGRVQGVGFRQAMRSVAQQLGVAGWCRNRKDGRVEAEVWGEMASVQKLLMWCQEGPRNAEVAEIVVEDMPVDDWPPLSTTFEIR